MSVPSKVQTILFASIPKGTPTLENFKFVERDLPKEIKDGQVLVKCLYFSVDPYLRGHMSGVKGYSEPFVINEPMRSGGVGTVVLSKSDKIKQGDTIIGELQWSEYVAVDEKALYVLQPPITPEVSLGVCGAVGVAAYFGLLSVGKFKTGDTVVISAAAGATGSIAGQIAKLKGAKSVIGIAGSDDKVNWLVKELGFDHAINYKTEKDLTEAIKKVANQGVDVYFDNVGGSTLTSIVPLMNTFGRIISCGSISTYNTGEATPIPLGNVIGKRLTIQGFIAYDFASEFGTAVQELTKWYSENKVKNTVTIVDGFANIPTAFLNLFVGANTGKTIVKI